MIAGMARMGSRIDGGDFAVDADEGDGVGTFVRGAAAEREGGDVDAELAERRTDLADDARFVVVAEVENGAFELRFERDALNLSTRGEPSWRTVPSAVKPLLRERDGGFGYRMKLKGVATSGAAAP